jgi:transposase InsO family protein
MESTIGLYKTECIRPAARGRNWAGLHEVERETAEWVRWYNHERIHSSINYMTPIEREVAYTDTIAQRGEVA